MSGFVDDAARVAFRDAVRAVESGSKAEVVVSVRRKSALWWHAHFVVAILAAIAAQAYMLFADTPFSTVGLFTGPIIAGAVAGAASTLVLPLQRWLTPPGPRRRAVRAAARAEFVVHGMRRTRDATGVLVYVSLVERMAEVVADDGIMAAVDAAEWATMVAAVDAAVPRGGRAVASAIEAMAPALARALPAGDDDINELPDDMHHGDAE